MVVVVATVTERIEVMHGLVAADVGAADNIAPSIIGIGYDFRAAKP